MVIRKEKTEKIPEQLSKFDPNTSPFLKAAGPDLKNAVTTVTTCAKHETSSLIKTGLPYKFPRDF